MVSNGGAVNEEGFSTRYVMQGMMVMVLAPSTGTNPRRIHQKNDQLQEPGHPCRGERQGKSKKEVFMKARNT
jgi:hypothetical protein